MFLEATKKISTWQTAMGNRRAGARSMATLLWIALAVVSPAALLAADYRVEVEQGGVGRWDGEQVEACGMDGRTFAPVDGSCWYPIDFERRPGLIEIARWTKGSGIDSGWLKIVEGEFPTQDIDFPDESYVHLSEEDLARHYSEQARLKPLLRRGWKKPARFSIPLGKPASSLPAGNGFGAHRTFNGEPKNRHTGTDYPIPAGTPILAVGGGSVILAEDHFFAGKGVYINHGNGLFSLSFHFQETSVEADAEVSKGDQIGECGSTGRSTGPHLHLGLRWRGARINPDWLISKVGSIPRVESVD